MNKKKTKIKSLGLLAGGLVAVLLASTVSAEEIQTRILQNDAISVAYEPPLEAAAGEVLQIYPLLKQELEQIFSWNLDVKPRVVLINSSRTFSKLAGSPFIVGFAVPARNLIVIDHTKMKTRPFNLRPPSNTNCAIFCCTSTSVIRTCRAGLTRVSASWPATASGKFCWTRAGRASMPP